MSKDLAFEQSAKRAQESQLWDTHEEPKAMDIVPLEFKEETSPELFGIEPVRAKEMVKGLTVTVAERHILENAYIDVIELPVTTETLPIFKELRLKIQKNRTQGLTKWKEKEKAFYLAGGNFIQAIYNKEVAVNEHMESKLMECEKFFERQEKQKAKDLNDARIERLKPYIEDTTGLDFAVMNDEDFDDYFLGKKTRYDQKIEAEKQEAIRVENERIISELHEKRKLESLPYLSFWSDFEKDLNFGKQSESDFNSFLERIKKAKNDFDAEQEKIRVENARLQKEAVEKERQRQSEIKAEQEKQAKLKANADKLQAELQAKKDARNIP